MLTNLTLLAAVVGLFVMLAYVLTEVPKPEVDLAHTRHVGPGLERN